VTLTDPNFEHLRTLTDSVGVFEHAEWAKPREECGYCVDDVARALVVTVRQPESSESLRDLTDIYLAFLLSAQHSDGRFINRRDPAGNWQGHPEVADCWGRAMWALGLTATHHADPNSRAAALAAFTRAARWRSQWRRPMAYAALGAAEVLQAYPQHSSARKFLLAAVNRIGRPVKNLEWPWPEPRLSYANALLPEALIAAGVALRDVTPERDGLLLLAWLLDVETRADRLSVTPVGGRGPGERGPAYDQQPIEVAALAEACARAYDLTTSREWLAGLDLAAAWFTGRNDNGSDLTGANGGGCDGLIASGRNENMGAESTIALLATQQQAQRCLVAIA
jgi:hypothetical protein